MKTKWSFIALLVLFAVFMTAGMADAQVRVPFQNAWWTKVLVTPAGPSALTGIVNVDDEPVEVDFYIFDTTNHVKHHQNFILDAHKVRTWNLGNLGLPYTPSAEYPAGEFQGYFKFHASRRVLIGDVFVVNFARSLADGNQLIPLDDCGDVTIRQCDTYAIRYLQGGTFDGGTLISGNHQGSSFDVRDIEVELYSELGQAAGSFVVFDAPMTFDFKMGDYSPVEPFGWGFIYLPAWGSITGMYSAFDQFSVGLEGWCIPPCDRCDPLGMCYNPNSSCGAVCVPADLRLSAGSSQVCQVGAPFSATFVALGTNVGPILCDPLPAGLTRTGNTIAGICENTLIPFIRCNVVNTCGNDEVIIPVQEGPPQYEIEVEKLIQEKGCLNSGQTETYAIFNIIVRNRGTDPIVVDISDPSAPECNRQNQTIINGTPYTATCTVQYPLGHHSNTAFVTIDGTTIEVSSTAEFDIVSCPLACDGVAQPAFSIDLLSQTNATATTRSILDFEGTGVVGNINFQAPTLPTGGFTGGNVVDNSNNDSIFQKTASVQTVVANWSVSRNSETCYNGSDTLTIQPQAGCDAYPEPTITLTEISELTTTHKIVNISPSPGGGTFNRPVPVSIPRPAYGQPAGSETFLYSLPYTPTGTTLSCTATKSVTVTVPPKDPTCADLPVDVIEGTPTTTLTSTSMTVTGLPFTTSPNTAGTMVWTPSLPSGPHSRPLYGQPTGSVSFTGVYIYNPATGLTCTAPAAKTVPIPPRDPQCSDFPTPPTQTFTPNTTLNTTTMVVNSISASPGLTGGAYNPTLPRTFNRPAAGQPAGTASFTYSGTWAPVTGLSCSASYPVSVPIPPQSQTCANFPVDVIEGTPTTTTTSTAVTVTALPYTTSPNTAGTMVWTPTLPKTVTRPLFGQPAGSQPFTGVFTYTPATGLTCTANASKTVSIPPQDCATSYPPTFTTPTVSSNTVATLTASTTVSSSGEHEIHIHATSSNTECTNHTYDHPNKDSDKVDLACGPNSQQITTIYNRSGHPDEWWRVELTRDGVRVWESSCLQNNFN